MSRIAIYARKSTESDDRQVLSLPAQITWARDVCRQHGLRDPLLFEEARSAKTPGRPAFDRMMQLVARGEITIIVCWKADRLARNARDGGTVLYALESKQLSQIITTDRTYNGVADDELVLTIELGLSSKYSKDLSKNVRRGLEEKWRRGEWTSHAPIGYRNVRENADHARIVLDPVLAPRVQELFRLAATGNYSINNLTAIARDEWRVNLTRLWRHSAKRGISAAAVHRMLRNPFYYGAMRVKEQLFPGEHQPLVSKTVFDRVQRILAGRRTVAERPKKRTFAFSGMVRCGTCGRRLVGYAKQKRGREYRYYACSKHLRGLCPQPQLTEAALLTTVRPSLAAAAITREDFTIIEQILSEDTATYRDEQESEQRRAESELIDINQRRSRLVDLLLEGAIPREEYDRKHRELSERHTEHALAVNATGGPPSWQEPLTTFFSTLTDADSLFEQLPDAEKGGLLRQVGLELEARGKRALVHATNPAAAVMRRNGDLGWWWIVDNVRNYFAFRGQIEGFLIPSDAIN
jgi:site-specific DNA recombinase